MTSQSNDNFSIGYLNFDQHEITREHSAYYLKNGDISDYSNSNHSTFVQNALSNELCVTLPFDGDLIGHINLDKDRLVLFSKTINNNYIYLLDTLTCELTLKAEGTCLNFQEYITGVYKYKGCELFIYFTDGINPIRYMSLDNPPKKNLNPCNECTPEYVDELDCNQLKIFKCQSYPNIQVEITEGNIPDGVYQFGIALSEDNTKISEIFVYSQIFNLHQINQRGNRFGFKLNVDCPSEYKLYLIVHREDRGTVAQEIGTFNSKQVSITELDSVSYLPISNEELFFTKVYYQSAKHIASNSDHLVFSSLTERNEFKYDTSKIKSYVDIIKVPSKYAHRYPSFMSDEVYPFFIQWVYCDGQSTKWTLINSDAPYQTSYETIVSNNDIWINPCEAISLKHWEVYNTAKLLTLSEENDNGSRGLIINQDLDPTCVNYKIETDQKGWQGKLTYTDCDGNEVVELGLPGEFEFCTKNINTASFEFVSFNNSFITQIGKCSQQQVTESNCKKFRITGFQDTVTGVNFNYESCTPDLTNNGNDDDVCGIVTIEPATTNLQDFEFCACNYSNDGTVDIVFNIDSPSYSFIPINVCGEITNTTEEESDRTECDYKVIGTSTFAYWKSSIEDCGEIKYHKFPDRTQILNNKHFPHIHSNTSSIHSKEYVYILAPRFENIEKPKDCNGNLVKDIVGYRIGVGNRANNKSIVHKGLLYNMRMDTDCVEDIYYANYPFNDLRPDQLIGTEELIRTGTGPIQASVGTFKPQTKYSKNKFQYISPDIQYEKNDQQGTELITYCEENGYIEGSFQETKELPEVVILEEIIYVALTGLIVAGLALEVIPLVAGGADVFNLISVLPETLRKFTDGKNYGINNTILSNLTKRNWDKIIIGNRRRKIEESFYMQPVKQRLDGIKVNNFQRESGLFLSLNSDIENPSIVDNSRFTIDEIDNQVYSFFDQSKRTSQYYVGIKRRLPNQYGRPQDNLVRPISDIITESETNSLISGDIYITKHTFYKKFPFFTNLPINAPYDSPYVTSEYLNIGFPKYWLDVNTRSEFYNMVAYGFSNIAILGNIALGLINQSIFKKPWNLEDYGRIQKLKCGKKKRNKIPFIVDGHFYTHYIGIVQYYCESEYIGEYRETSEIPQSLYFPIKDIASFSNYETIQYPEIFLYSQAQRYNGLLSKQTSLLSECKEECFAKNRVIFSNPQDTLSKKDKWLDFLPNNYHQFNQQDGDFTNSHMIDDGNLLFLFDNAAYITQSSEGIITTNGVSYLGQGSIFERRMKKISSEVNGLGGCIDKLGVVNTPWGCFWPDRIRKTFIGYSGNGLIEINNNMRSWFNEFMDSPIVGHYDPYSRNIYWTSNNWTISFKPELKAFVSFHDFIPNYYLPMHYNFLTNKPDGDNKGIWKHNKKNHYQTYYNQTYPFEIGYTINHKFQQNVLQSIQIHAEFFKHEGFGRKRYTKDFFDQFFQYNDFTSTGVKTLLLKDINDPKQSLVQYNINSPIEVTNTEYDSFNINGFQNHLINNAKIEWVGYKYNTLNTNENIVNSNNGLIRGKWHNIHLISNALPDQKKLVELSLNLKDEVK